MHGTRTIVVLALALAFPTPGTADENWPRFRGPSADGHADGRGLPLTWAEDKNVVWKTAIHDKGWSSPVIWGDQVWMTTARADGKELFAVCVNRDTGKIVHDLKVFDIAEPAFCIAYNSYASPTPVIEAGRVYVHFGSAGTACLDTATGKVLWTRTDLPCNHHRGAGSSPILYGDLLILTFDGFDLQYLVALDKATGKTVWKKDRGIQYTKDDGDIKKAYGTPSVLEIDGKPQLIAPSAEATIAYDPRTGAELWRLIHGGMNAATTPLYGHGRIYLTSGARVDTRSEQLLAVRPGGRIDWSMTKNVPSRPSPLLVGDFLYAVSDQGIASCVDAKTGEVVTTARLKGKFSASPIFAAGRIYFVSEDGPVTVVEPGRELKVLAVNALDEGCMASPAVSGSALFLRTRTHLYRIEQK
jgi:outer membrane protein assembly factor BamB